MKVISRIAILVVVALVVAAGMQTANATCAIGHTVSGCAGGCKYIITNGGGASPNIAGNWWGLGGGNPALGLGDDNGGDLATGNADSSIDWIKFYGANAYLAGAWATALVDGCIENATTPSPKRTAVAYSDSAAGAGYFLVLCNIGDVNGNFDFAQGGSGPDHVLAKIPRAFIQSSSRVTGTSASLNFGGPQAASLAAGTLAFDPSCTGLIRGYKHYTQTRPNAAGAPTDLNRTTGGWVPQGGENPIAASSAFTAPCGPATSVWVGDSLVFDSGYETPYVSQPLQVPCDPTLSDRPSNFKIIKKPRGQQRQGQN